MSAKFPGGRGGGRLRPSGQQSNSFSPKMCRKNFENQLVNKNLTSKNVLNRDICMEKMLVSHYFSGKKNKIFNILFKFHEPTQNCQKSLPGVQIKSTNLPESKGKRFLDYLSCLCKTPIQKHSWTLNFYL